MSPPHVCQVRPLSIVQCSASGYEEQKRQIEDTVLLALLHPEVYEGVAKGTRKFAADSTRPRAVLFEGPPGCGKTTSARCVSGTVQSSYVTGLRSAPIFIA